MKLDRLGLVLITVLHGACDDGADSPASTLDATMMFDQMTDQAIVDARLPDLGVDAAVESPGAECAPAVLERGNGRTMAECVESQPLGDDEIGGTRLLVRADCTDENITALVEKQHMVMIGDAPGDTLWVHFGGSGGQPTNTENIGLAAVASGYRYISLAYPNEPSIAERCTCEGIGPRPIECEALVRYEIVYGRDVTPWFEMEADEAIVPRLVALLRALDAARPNGGWTGYLDGEQPNWSRIAVSGFSQGGGMAGLIARDHAVVRAMYLSKGAGSVPAEQIDPASATPCSAREECPSLYCGTLAQPTNPEAPGATCLTPVPVPTALTGRDVDGDGLGDGGPETRATPPERQFALVHRDEGAWFYSPEIFAAWGLGAREDFVDVDVVRPPFGAAQLFNIGAEPRLSCSEHQAMGADACMPRRRDGRPVVWDAWLHAMQTR